MTEKNKDLWFVDQTIPRDESDEINEALDDAGRIDPRWLNLIWERDKKKIH